MDFSALGLLRVNTGKPGSPCAGVVAATIAVIDQICGGRNDIPAARSSLEDINQMPPASTLRFALMAGAGAAALGVTMQIAFATIDAAVLAA